MFLSVLNSKGSASTWDTDSFTGITLTSVFAQEASNLEKQNREFRGAKCTARDEVSVPGRADSSMLWWCLPDIDHVGFFYCFFFFFFL